MAITKEQAISANNFHHNTEVNADGSCQRWRRNGKTKTWKTRPSEFLIPVKRGFKEYNYISDKDADQFHPANTCERR